jgi:DNA-binding protein H-NS
VWISIEIFFYWISKMNATAVSSSFASMSSASAREQLRAQLERQLAELDQQDELERAARRAPVVDQVKALIAEYKLSSSELFPAKDKAEALYRYYDEKEKDTRKRNKTWNGRGTMPSALKGREEECLIPGQEHTKSIKKVLEARTASQPSTSTPNSESCKAQVARNAAEPQPNNRNVPLAHSADHALPPSTSIVAIDVEPDLNTTAIHPESQESGRPIAPVDVSSVALPT